MPCPYCASVNGRETGKRTALDYLVYWCGACRRTFNERTGTCFNHLTYPTDLVFLVVLWRLRHHLCLRNLAEMFLERGMRITHERVHEWERRFAPLLTDRLRNRRSGKAGRSWHCDETYSKVQGRWCYLYRAIDRDGNLVDSLLSTTRDMSAAKRFFSRAIRVVGHTPERVTTHGHDAYPRTIRETLGEDVVHRCSRYLNNRIEQDHRGIKGRYHLMRGFGTFVSAARFCSAYDELRDYFRLRIRMDEVVPLGIQREQFQARSAELRAMLKAA